MLLFLGILLFLSGKTAIFAKTHHLSNGLRQFTAPEQVDFTTDPAVLDEILGGHSEADKDDFLRHVDQDRAMTFMYFADLCGDKKLAQAIEKEFGEEWRAIHNE